MDERIRSLRRDGFLVVKNMMSREEVSRARSCLREALDRLPGERALGEEANTLENVWARYPKLRWVLFHEPMLRVLRGFLGEKFAILRDAAAHSNNFTSWHRDTIAFDDAQATFHLRRDFRVINVAYYLQDAINGGLEVVPQSHRSGRRWIKSLMPHKEPFAIPIKAGDAILFDADLLHRGAPRHPTATEEKMAIFFATCPISPYAREFNDLLLVHHQKCNLYLKDFHYPDDFIGMAEKYGLSLP